MIEVIKNVTFICLAIISTFLSLNMFFQLGVETLEKVVFGIVSLALEGLKIFTLVNANLYWDLKKVKQAIIRYAMYSIIAIISILASFGYTLTTIDRIKLEATYVSNKVVIQNYDLDIKTYDTQINQLLSQVDKVDPTWVTARQRISNELEKIQQKKTELITKQQELKKKEVDSVTFGKTSKSMFALIGEFLGIAEQFTMFLIMIVISITIEVGIVMTSPHLNKNHFKKKIVRKKKEQLPKVKERSKILEEPEPEELVKEPELLPKAPSKELLVIASQEKQEEKVKEAIEKLKPNIQLSHFLLSVFDAAFSEVENTGLLVPEIEVAEKIDADSEKIKKIYKTLLAIKQISFDQTIQKWKPLTSKDEAIIALKDSILKTKQ